MNVIAPQARIAAPVGIENAAVSADPTKKSAAPALAAPAGPVDVVASSVTVNEDAIRALDTSSGSDAARNARGNVGIEGAPRIGVVARLEASSTTVQGAGGAKP